MHILHLGRRLGVRVRFYILAHSVPWIESQGKGSRNQILLQKGTRSTRLEAMADFKYFVRFHIFCHLHVGLLLLFVNILIIIIGTIYCAFSQLQVLG